MNWNDLTYLLAVMRGSSLTQAARLMGVDKSTVSRRLGALEADLGVPLVERASDGRISLTGAGRKVVRRAEAIEDQARGLSQDLGQAQMLGGRVRLTAVPLVINHLLLPQVPVLVQENPNLSVDLISDARDLNLLDFDADIALRLARPKGGGQGVIARRLGGLPYGCYGAAAAEKDLPWIGYDQRMQFLEHAAQIEHLAAAPGQRRGALSVNDAETLVQAIRAGQGKSLLPHLIASQIGGLKEYDIPAANLATREVWLLVRRDMRDLDRIKAVIDWIGQVFKPML